MGSEDFWPIQFCGTRWSYSNHVTKNPGQYSQYTNKNQESLPKIRTRTEKIGVVVIINSGKPSNTKLKDFRLISFSPFLLKTPERLVDLFIKENIKKNSKPKISIQEVNQWKVHYTRMYGLQDKEYAQGTLINREGAFKNINTERSIRLYKNWEVKR